MNDLKLIENDLVPVYKTDTGEQVVYGSDLHRVLEVKSNYREWSARRIMDLSMEENVDYQAVEISTPSGQRKIDHIILLDLAKEMAMLERNEKGKQVRRYFIEIEKKYKQSVRPMTREELLSKAVLEAQNVIKELEDKNKEQEKTILEQKPLVDFANHVSSTSCLLTVEEVAKIACKQGIQIGRTNLFKWLREKKYLQKNNMPYQRYIDNGLFKVVEKKNSSPYGPDVYVMTYVTGKGQITIIEGLREEHQKQLTFNEISELF